MTGAISMLQKTAAKKTEKSKEETHPAIIAGGAGLASGAIAGAGSKVMEGRLTKQIVDFEKEHHMSFSPKDKAKFIRKGHLKSIGGACVGGTLTSLMARRLSRKKDEAKK